MDSRVALPVLDKLQAAGDEKALAVLKQVIKGRLTARPRGHSFTVLKTFVEMGKPERQGYIYSFDQSDWNDVLGAIAYGTSENDEHTENSLDQLLGEMQALRVARFLLHEDEAWFRPRLPGWILQMVAAVPTSYSVYFPQMSEWVKERVKSNPTRYFITNDRSSVEVRMSWMANVLYIDIPFSNEQQLRFNDKPFSYLEGISVNPGWSPPQSMTVPGIGGPLITNTSFIFNHVATPETVRDITINRCGLERLENFGKFTNLRKLEVMGNHGLKHVDDIVGMDKLAVIRIGKSSLDDIEWLVPRAGRPRAGGMPSLEKLTLGSSEPFDVNPAGQLEHVKILNIRHHPGLRAVGRDAFPPNTEVLNFVYSNLQYIDPDALSGLHGLVTFAAGRTQSIPENIDEIVEALVELHYRFGTLQKFYPPMAPGGPESPVNAARFKPLVDAGFKWTFRYEHALMKE